MKTILNYFNVVNSGELTNSSKFADFIKEVEKANKVKILTFSLTRGKIILYSEVNRTGDFFECELQDNELKVMVHGTIYKAPTALEETKLDKAKQEGEKALRNAYKGQLTAGTMRERKYYQEKFEQLEFLLLEMKLTNPVRVDRIKWETEYVYK